VHSKEVPKLGVLMDTPMNNTKRFPKKITIQYFAVTEIVRTEFQHREVKKLYTLDYNRVMVD